MSCDDNHEARAKDRVRRSLPVVSSGSGSRPGESGAGHGAAAAASASARQLWRSIEERTRAITPGAANEFPGGAAELDGVSRRGFMQLLGVSTAVATVGAACR